MASAGMRLPRRQRCVARTAAMLKRVLRQPHTWEYGRLHFSDKREARRRMTAFASLPKRPSTETTKGVKSRRCSRQSSRYFFFFSRSCDSMTLWGFHPRWDLASVSVMRTSRMQEAPFRHRLRTRRSPLRSSTLVVTSGVGSSAQLQPAMIPE